MREYQGFAISNFRTGWDEAVEPWLLPRDAMQVTRNAHYYRGVIEKIPGYTLYARMSYRQIIDMTGIIDGVNKTFTTTLSALPSTQEITVQSTINGTATAIETFVSDGEGVLTGSNGGTGSINLITGAVTVTFGLDAPADLTEGGIQYNSVILTYDSLATASPTDSDIMGIYQYYAQNTNQEILIFNTRRVGKIVGLSGSIGASQNTNQGISEIPHSVQVLATPTGFNGVSTGPFTGTITSPVVPGTIVFTIYDSSSETANLVGTITDNGDGLLVGSLLDPGVLNLINYATGQWTMTFLVPPLATYQMNYSAGVYGDLFTGDFTNFFDLTNYQFNAFFTNNVDPPMYYDGSIIHYLNTNVTSKPNTIAPYDISRVLHLVVNRERLILLNVVFQSIDVPNGAYWSTAGNALDFTDGGNLPASTSEAIRDFSIINTDVVVRFSNSERVLRYTGDPFSPFRWDSTNVLWRCDANFSSINYDSWFSSVGKPAIVGSDGVNVKRADEIIPDFTLNSRVSGQQPVLSIDQQSIGQCYGIRFDDFKEGWMCYKEYSADDGVTTVARADTVLAFNYLDSTYTTYTFPFSVLGFGRVIGNDVWGNTYETWEEADFTWGSYTETQGALIDLGGDHNGNVYQLGTGSSITDMAGNQVPCLFEIITKDFNPYVEGGELARLGYVDLLLSTNADTKLRLQFYIDNELDTNFDTFYQETTIQLTGMPQYKVWKRIYVGAVGKTHTIRIYQSEDDFTSITDNQPVNLHAIVPYFKPAGRIFQ